MNKALFGITLLLVIGLFLAGCSNVPESSDNTSIIEGEKVTQNTGNTANTADQSSSEAYVDEQIVDENESVEIGQMI